MIRITDFISIHEDELCEQFVRSSGPGGQNVNKVSSAVELRFDARGSKNLPLPVRIRLQRLAGRRMTNAGVVIIKAERFRTQERNRSDARARLIDLLVRAAVAPRPRLKRLPSRAAKERRLQAKARRSDIKRGRRSKPIFD